METIQSQFQEKLLSIFGSFFTLSHLLFLPFSPLSHLFILSYVDSLPSRFSFFISFHFSYHSKNFLFSSFSLFFLLHFSLSLFFETLRYNRTHDSHAYYQLSFCTFLSIESDLRHSLFSSLPIFPNFNPSLFSFPHLPLYFPFYLHSIHSSISIFLSLREMFSHQDT